MGQLVYSNRQCRFKDSLASLLSFNNPLVFKEKGSLVVTCSLRKKLSGWVVGDLHLQCQGLPSLNPFGVRVPQISGFPLVERGNIHFPPTLLSLRESRRLLSSITPDRIWEIDHGSPLTLFVENQKEEFNGRRSRLGLLSPFFCSPRACIQMCRNFAGQHHPASAIDD